MKIIVLSFVFFILELSLSFGQSSSTYTRYGIGDYEYSYSARRSGLGKLGVAVSDADFINSINPAGWYKISKTRFELGITLNGIFVSDNKQKSYSAETEINGFTFGFPVSSEYGIAVAAGLIPVTNVSYKTAQTYTVGDPINSTYNLSYEGSGGLSKMFIGSSYELPGNFLFGASFDYYFGNIDYLSTVDFIDGSGTSAKYNKQTVFNGIGGTFGFISPNLSNQFDILSISDFRIAGSISYFGKIKADTVLTSQTLGVIDSIFSGGSDVNIPPRITLGISSMFSDEYLVALDYSFQQWSDYEFAGKPGSNLRNSFLLSAGFEYRPKRSIGSTFWEQIMLRAGLNFEQTQYVFNNIGINKYSVSGGASIPLGSENTLDIGLEYFIRGKIDSGLLKEEAIKLNLGISLGELWFIRYDK